MARHAPRFLPSGLRRFIESETAGGIVLMLSAAVALVIANSALAGRYQAAAHHEVGGLSMVEWINDALMAVFFLLVGLEIKREMLHGQLRTWSDRALPGLAALGGMIVPAAIFAIINVGQPSLRGWAIPAATDIAFALGVIALLGKAVPVSLKVFLTALAVLDDLGAVLIIGVFYTADIALPMLAGAALTFAALVALNRFGVRSLLPYLVLGAALWVFVFRSGVHATVAGVLLAMTIPADAEKGADRTRSAPLTRLERALDPWVAFVILPIFGFANAGVSLSQAGWAAAASPITLGVAFGLLLGKQTGVLASIWLALRLGLATRPAGARWVHLYGMAVLCGVGFTMSLFIGLLAFARSPIAQDETKIGVLAGSLLSAAAGALIFRLAPKPAKPGALPS